MTHADNLFWAYFFWRCASFSVVFVLAIDPGCCCCRQLVLRSFSPPPPGFRFRWPVRVHPPRWSPPPPTPLARSPPPLQAPRGNSTVEVFVRDPGPCPVAQQGSEARRGDWRGRGGGLPISVRGRDGDAGGRQAVRGPRPQDREVRGPRLFPQRPRGPDRHPPEAARDPDGHGTRAQIHGRVLAATGRGQVAARDHAER